MMSKMADVKFRHGTVDDEERFGSLDKDIYAGRDHHVAKYKYYLSDPNRTVWVCEIDGKAMAFNVMNTIDGGRSFIGEAGRTDPKIRHQGVIKQFQGFLLKDLLERSSHPITGLMATLDRQTPLRNTLKPHIIAHRYILGFFLKNRLHVLSQDAPSTYRALRSQDMEKYFEDVDVQLRFFPSRRIVSDWKPYRLQKENYDVLAKENCLILANIDTKNECQEYVESVSFGREDKVLLGDQYSIDYYGNSEEDCLHHISLHLKRVVSKSRAEQFLFRISFSPSALDVDRLMTRLPSVLGDFKEDTFFKYREGLGMWILEFQAKL